MFVYTQLLNDSNLRSNICFPLDLSIRILNIAYKGYQIVSVPLCIDTNFQSKSERITFSFFETQLLLKVTDGIGIKPDLRGMLKLLILNTVTS